jgi:lipopolysaccharide transport system ATP-binding protein
MLRDLVVDKCKKVVGFKGKTQNRNVIWALSNISLKVEEGEVVGVIGRNGAGKSTLLKILSHITYPTSGRLEVNGRVGSLLEVGTGFHEELTGRENIYLCGSILGMRKREIDASLDQIVEFADIERFLDTPIKRYSSGMRLRLGFSVAAHLRTDVLFIDEVLAVGDVAFQKKCLGTMRQLSDGGRTVIFVSHDMAAVENLCKRTVWIADGKVKQDGGCRDVISAYLNSLEAVQQQSLDLAAIRERKGTGDVRFVKMEFINEYGSAQHVIQSGDPVHIKFQYECQRELRNLYFGLRIFSNLGTLISDVHSWATNQPVIVAPRGRGVIELKINTLNLTPGAYYAGLWAATPGEWHDVLDHIAKIDVQSSDYYGTGRAVDARYGLVVFSCQWKVPYNGRADSAETGTTPAINA